MAWSGGDEHKRADAAGCEVGDTPAAALHRGDGLVHRGGDAEHSTSEALMIPEKDSDSFFDVFTSTE